MTFNQNVSNVFDETEQAAFHPGHIVPGIDFSNDPLLQGRLFSYTDTQISRLGGPNFNQIPINRPVNEVHNNQRDAMHQMNINKGQVAYHKNALTTMILIRHLKKKAAMNIIKKKLKDVKYKNVVKALKIIIVRLNYI